jgi:hypothetical protein
METTAKKITFRATKEDTRQMEELIKQLGESQSQILRRALHDLYRLTFSSAS